MQDIRRIWALAFPFMIAGVARADAAQGAATPAAQPPAAPRPQRVTLTDEWVMSQHTACGEVRGRLRAIGVTANDSLLRGVAGARARWLTVQGIARNADTGAVTRDDGVFELRGPGSGAWRLEITRAGLPDVSMPLVFGTSSGYVVEIAIGSKDPHDERWGTTLQIVRAAQPCGGGAPAVDISKLALNPALLATQSFDRASRIAIMASLAAAAVPGLQRWRADRAEICVRQALDTTGLAHVLYVVDGVPRTPADTALGRTLQGRAVVKRDVKRTGVALGGVSYDAIVVLKTRLRTADAPDRCVRFHDATPT